MFTTSTPLTRAVKKRQRFHLGVELAQLSERKAVIFLDVKATPADCDGASGGVIFLDAKTLPVRTLNTLCKGADVLGGERYPFREHNLGYEAPKYN